MDDLTSFPDGWYPAKIIAAETSISKNGNAQFVVDFEIEHKTAGSARLRDWIMPSFPPKARAFYRAYQGMTADEFRQYLDSEGKKQALTAEELLNAKMLVHLGSEEYNGNLRKTVVPGYYASQDQTDLLNWLN